MWTRFLLAEKNEKIKNGNRSQGIFDGRTLGIDGPIMGLTPTSIFSPSFLSFGCTTTALS